MEPEPSEASSGPSKEDIVAFFHKHTAYDTMPESGKVIVLDVDLTLHAAFRALVTNEVNVAALYDAKSREHCGVLTPLELAHAIARFHRDQGGESGQSQVMERLMSSVTLREELASNITHATIKQLETAPEQNLFEICQMLHTHKVRYLPVMERKQDNTMLHATSHSSLLRFFVFHFQDLVRKLDDTLQSTNLLTPTSDLRTVQESARVSEAVQALSAQSLPAVPVLKEDGTVSAVFCECDIAELAALPGTGYDLDKPMTQVLASSREFGRELLCQPEESLGTILHRFALSRGFCLLCVDNETRPICILSLADIFRYFALE